jgi:hypothetical protein
VSDLTVTQYDNSTSQPCRPAAAAARRGRRRRPPASARPVQPAASQWQRLRQRGLGAGPVTVMVTRAAGVTSHWQAAAARARLRPGVTV